MFLCFIVFVGLNYDKNFIKKKIFIDWLKKVICFIINKKLSWYGLFLDLIDLYYYFVVKSIFFLIKKILFVLINEK